MGLLARHRRRPRPLRSWRPRRPLRRPGRARAPHSRRGSQHCVAPPPLVAQARRHSGPRRRSRVRRRVPLDPRSSVCGFIPRPRRLRASRVASPPRWPRRRCGCWPCRLAPDAFRRPVCLGSDQGSGLAPRLPLACPVPRWERGPPSPLRLLGASLQVIRAGGQPRHLLNGRWLWPFLGQSTE